MNELDFVKAEFRVTEDGACEGWLHVMLPEDAAEAGVLVRSGTCQLEFTTALVRGLPGGGGGGDPPPPCSSHAQARGRFTMTSDRAGTTDVYENLYWSYDCKEYAWPDSSAGLASATATLAKRSEGNAMYYQCEEPCDERRISHYALGTHFGVFDQYVTGAFYHNLDVNVYGYWDGAAAVTCGGSGTFPDDAWFYCRRV